MRDNLVFIFVAKSNNLGATREKPRLLRARLAASVPLRFCLLTLVCPSRCKAWPSPSATCPPCTDAAPFCTRVPPTMPLSPQCPSLHTISPLPRAWPSQSTTCPAAAPSPTSSTPWPVSRLAALLAALHCPGAQFCYVAVQHCLREQPGAAAAARAVGRLRGCMAGVAVPDALAMLVARRDAAAPRHQASSPLAVPHPH